MNAVVEDAVSSGREPVPPWLTPSAYWLPQHFPRSAWVTHGAFASWIVATLRPLSIVELGTHFGFSCFAFAEAVRRLGLGTKIYALDTWEGDDHAGFYGDDVYDYARSIAQADYPESVRMMRGLFAESRGMFANGSVDVLHIDGRHGYEDVREDYDQWVSTVRDGGVILFHDIAERRDDFGVWRLWGEVAVPGRSFAFEHGHGLGVLAVGESIDPSLEVLFHADEAVRDRIRDDFQTLGDRLAHQAMLEMLPEELSKVRGELEDARRCADQQERLLVESRRQIDALKSSTSWVVTAPLRAVGRLWRRIA